MCIGLMGGEHYPGEVLVVNVINYGCDVGLHGGWRPPAGKGAKSQEPRLGGLVGGGMGSWLSH